MILKIPEPLLSCLREIGEVGGKSTYLVGGLVRDLLLKRDSLDIDIVVEGDAPRVAEAMRERWDGTLNVHPQFGTATVTPANPSLPKVDFVTARRETYQHPGTLPIVKQGTIVDDLRRRDFTINALAMRLDADAFGTIVDETGGLADLEAGTIRVLHKQSFMEDPTRIFRACRYAGRYGFHIADDDAVLIRDALPVLSGLSGERIRNELGRVLLEENAPQIVQQLTAFDVWAAVSAGWEISENFARIFTSARQAIRWASEHLIDEKFDTELVRWMAFLGATLRTYRLEALSFRLVLPHQLHRLVSCSPQDSGVDALFQRAGLPLSPDAVIEHHNGKLLVVDAENGQAYVCGDGSLYRVQTPLTTYSDAMWTMFIFLHDAPSPGAVYYLLKPYPLEALALTYFVADDESKAEREQIGTYLHTLRKVQPLVTGRDLVQWGEKPGKSFETFLSRLFSAQLDGEINTKSEAHRWLQEFKKASAEAVSEK